MYSNMNKNQFKRCLSNMGFFNIDEYRKKYKNIIPLMYTYRSLNTYCRMNLDRVIQDTPFYYLQNDKIELHRFIEINKFKCPSNVFSTRSKPKTSDIRDVIHHYFKKHKGNKLILKPSHLSFSEGVVFLKNSEGLLDSHIDECYDYDCSFTEGGGIKNYNEKKGLIIQEALNETENVINEWKIMYIWGVPIVILWKIGHVHRYKIMTDDFKVLYQENKHGIKNIYPGIPPFAEEMIEEGSRMCKLTGAPFLRVDMLWNDDSYIVNETELLPSNYMFFPCEKLMMDLLKIPFGSSRDKVSVFTSMYLYEMFAYIYYIFHYLEYLLRRLNMSGLYKN